MQNVDCGEEIKNLILSIPTEGSAISCETLSIFYGVLSKLLPYLGNNQTLSKKEEIINHAKKYISAKTDCSAYDIAKECSISEPYLYMLFKEKAGCTPNDYKLKVNCQKGTELLLSLIHISSPRDAVGSRMPSWACTGGGGGGGGGVPR